MTECVNHPYFHPPKPRPQCYVVSRMVAGSTLTFYHVSVAELVARRFLVSLLSAMRCPSTSFGDGDSRRLRAVPKPRNLKGFKSQGMVVCAVEALQEGKVGVGCDTASPRRSQFCSSFAFQPQRVYSNQARLQICCLYRVLPILLCCAHGAVQKRV